MLDNLSNYMIIGSTLKPDPKLFVMHLQTVLRSKVGSDLAILIGDDDRILLIDQEEEEDWPLLPKPLQAAEGYSLVSIDGDIHHLPRQIVQVLLKNYGEKLLYKAAKGLQEGSKSLIDYLACSSIALHRESFPRLALVAAMRESRSFSESQIWLESLPLEKMEEEDPGSISRGFDQIFFKDVESMITTGVQFVFDRFEDRDKLARAREEEWREE